MKKYILLNVLIGFFVIILNMGCTTDSYDFKDFDKKINLIKTQKRQSGIIQIQNILQWDYFIICRPYCVSLKKKIDNLPSIVNNIEKTMENAEHPMMFIIKEGKILKQKKAPELINIQHLSNLDGNIVATKANQILYFLIDRKKEFYKILLFDTDPKEIKNILNSIL
jgi:hypothetical protein